jgi:hypothetical protein
MHNGFLNMNKEKMSKSLGNIVKPRDVYRRNDPEALRYALLTAHYRGPLSFDVDKNAEGDVVFPGVDEAERRIDYLYGTMERLAAYDESGEPDPKVKDLAAFRASIAAAQEKILTALDDDLNTPVALAELGELAKTANDLGDLLTKRKKDANLIREGSKLARAAREARPARYAGPSLPRAHARPAPRRAPPFSRRHRRQAPSSRRSAPSQRLCPGRRPAGRAHRARCRCRRFPRGEHVERARLAERPTRGARRTGPQRQTPMKSRCAKLRSSLA